MADWEDAPTSGWEDGKWEDAPEEKGFLDTVIEGGKQLGKNVGGAAVGLADLAAGAISAPVGYLKAATATAFGADPEKELEEARQVAGDNIGSAISKFGYGDPRENETYQMMMKPFEKISEGVDAAADYLGLGAGGKIAAEGALSVLPIPGSKLLGRGAGRVAEHVDPGLRRLDAESPTETRGRLDMGGWEDAPAQPRMIEETSGPVTVRYPAEPNPQLDFMEPINPYDVGGHVSGFKEGRTTQIDPIQAELGGRIERPDVVPDVVRDIENALNTRDFAARATQAELFDPYTNMHREFDQYGNEPLPKMLSKEEYTQTVQNLAQQEGTGFRMPDDMDAAYEAYTQSVGEQQGGLFDRPSQQAGFAETARQEGINRLRQAREDQINAHPVIKAARRGYESAVNKLEEMRADGADPKYVAAQERKVEGARKRLSTAYANIDKVTGDIDPSAYRQRPGQMEGPEINLGPNSREIALNQQFRSRMDPEAGQPPIPTLGSFIPEEVPQQFRDASKGVPGLGKLAPVTTIEPPLRATRVETPIEQVTKKVPGLNKEMERYVFDMADPATVIERAKQERDTTGAFEKAARYATSGANLASLTRRSSLIKGVYSYWNQAENTFRKAWNTKVIPVEKSLAHISKAERTELANLMRDEMFSRERNTEAVARSSEKIQKAYAKLRTALQEAGDAFNAGRVAAGKPPVSIHDYYMASRWRGNYKMEVRDRNGDLVWFLREPSQRALKSSAEALRKADPQLVFKEIEPGWKGIKSDQLEAGYLDMLKLLDENDPRVEALKSVYEEHIAREGEPSLGMPFHAENKSNVRGFIGDRPQRSKSQNAVELLNSQIQYMKNTYKWAAQMEANSKVKQLLSDPELQQLQPNNVAYAREYSKNALGFGTDVNVRNLESAVSRAFGFDREQTMAGLNNLRAYFYTKNLGLLNPKAMAVQMIQPIFTLPAQMDLVASGFKYNPVRHAIDTMSDLQALWGKSKDLRPETKAAIDYATENGILSINVLEDVRNIGQSALSQKATKYANINQVKAEEFGRTMAYVSMLNHFRQSGLEGETLYRSAEAAVNRIMTDYRKFEQPMWMQKGGMTTHAVGTLKTFLNNILNQYMHYGKEAVNGVKTGNVSKVAPFAAMLGLQFALAGTIGMPGAETLTSLYDDYILPAMGPNYADKSAKAAMVNSLSDTSLYGPLSTMLNANLQGSLSQGQIAGGGSLGEIALPFMSDIMKTAGATGKAIMNPTSGTKWAQAAYENLPPHLKGAMENLYPGFTSETGVSLNPRDTEKGMYKRNDFDSALRYLGATSMEETGTKNRAYEAQQQELRINEAKGVLKKGYAEALRSGNTEKMRDVVQTLSRWMGPDEIANYLTQGMQDSMKNRNRDIVRRLMPDNLNSVSAIQKYNRTRDMLGR